MLGDANAGGLQKGIVIVINAKVKEGVTGNTEFKLENVVLAVPNPADITGNPLSPKDIKTQGGIAVISADAAAPAATVVPPTVALQATITPVPVATARPTIGARSLPTKAPESTSGASSDGPPWGIIGAVVGVVAIGAIGFIAVSRKK